MSGFLHCYSPVDGRLYLERSCASETDIQQRLARAQQAQLDWRQRPLSERQQYCSRAVDALATQKAGIAEELCWMMGRPICYAPGEVDGFCERARYMINIAEQALAPHEVSSDDGQWRCIERRPLGVVFIISPWNYPYLTCVNSLIPALLAGNSVVLKCASQTAGSAERLAAAFKTAGLPDGVFQYLHLDHASTAAILQAGPIDHLVFTGSVTTGRQIEQQLAGRFIGATLELGGKDPAYIRADAELDSAVEKVVEGALFNSGQSCCAIERVYVDTNLHDAFIERASALIRRYRLNRPDLPETTLGPMVSARAASRVRAAIQQAIDQGAQPHIDEADFSASQPGNAYLAPQLLSQVTATMPIMQQETFGPVLAVQKVAGDEEAIALMNNSRYGLSAALFSRDLQRCQQLGRQLEVGTVFLNRCDYLDPALAWSGLKQSGRGHSLSRFGFETLTRLRSFNFNS